MLRRMKHDAMTMSRRRQKLEGTYLAGNSLNSNVSNNSTRRAASNARSGVQHTFPTVSADIVALMSRFSSTWVEVQRVSRGSNKVPALIYTNTVTGRGNNTLLQKARAAPVAFVRGVVGLVAVIGNRHNCPSIAPHSPSIRRTRLGAAARNARDLRLKLVAGSELAAPSLTAGFCAVIGWDSAWAGHLSHLWRK